MNALGFVPVVKVLLNHQADVSIRESDRGMTAIMLACESDYPEIVELLANRTNCSLEDIVPDGHGDPLLHVHPPPPLPISHASTHVIFIYH